MIEKLLIANRGEIACRIIRSCRKLGIRTVAAFSDADASALHVAMADEAVRIGPAEATASYLNVDAILDAARRTGANAVHPGYGFLSERVALAQGCIDNGIIWIGPSPRAIEAMGSKIESKRLAEQAGVASVPGYHGDAQDDAALEDAARKIGFPILIKASAGGGGRGMRRVSDAKEFRSALALARAEAQAGFGDPKLLIEKLIERPRHLEVQLAGDKHGNLIHLFERECSIQRNYQKVIEEAPAPNLDPEIREALFDAALKLGRAIGYDSLGTVEFILDADSKAGPWFLEMNTRLQVEHPVTEEVTGIDVVALQIGIAQGDVLPFGQGDLHVAGAAIEARLNAEDPAHGYSPSFGRVADFRTFSSDGVRIDTGIGPGSEVTPYYDSMLAKIIGYGPNREIAARRLSAALGELEILGLKTNQAFLRDLVDSRAFRAGNLSTRFIPELYPHGWTGQPEGYLPGSAVAAIAWIDTIAHSSRGAAPAPWTSLGNFRLLSSAGRETHISLKVEGETGETDLWVAGGDGNYRVGWPQSERTVRAARRDGDLSIEADGLIHRYRVAVDGDQVSIAHSGRSERWRVRPAIECAGKAGGDNVAASGTRVVAHLPGLISAIHVAPEQKVAKGETVIVIEAMKLMHGLPAPADGRVKGVFCQKGETVAAGTVLIEIDPEGSS
ncbi:MAG TPA: biotin carboxylase N-terminal domain-containing protein [Alphaproteobacteria bacterium]|nr:biotin carboxylase N-terminal domain-containing protein [Alphaproteobacteria bacterium]